jgi:LEA14-like dessication related protein
MRYVCPMAALAPWMRVAALAALLVLLACGKPELPTLTPVRVRVTSVSAAGIDVIVSLRATNPNRIDLPLRDLSGHVVINKTIDVGTVRVPVPVTLPANQTTDLDVPLSVEWQDLAVLAQLGALSGATPYTVDGDVGVGGDLVNVEVPYHLEGTVTQAQLLRVIKTSIPGLPDIPGLGGLLTPKAPPHGPSPRAPTR